MMDMHQRGPTSFVRSLSRAHTPLTGSRLLASHALSREERQAIEEAVAQAKPVKANVDLIREGERTDSLFILTDGWACRYTTTREGRRQIPALMVPGDVANLDALLFDRLDYGVRTLTQASVAVLPRDRALALAAQHPGVARTFTWLAMIENVILSRWALSLGRRTSRERLAHLLCELSVRLGGEDGNESNFAFPLTQETIADALGLTSVHVNRMMQQLRAEGLVATVGREVALPDVRAIQRAGGFDSGYLHIDHAAVPEHARAR